MCGIAGCVVPVGERPDRRALERMADALSHRGPDDRGIETWENVGLVNTRLAIVDPGPSGHQPIEDHSRRWLLTYNGEAYNHMDFRARIPHRWRGHSDTETLVEALAAWGPDAVERCNGPLALAGLDRESRRLVLARDRFGKKPLYLARRDGSLWFASEIRALLAAGIPARARREVLAHAITRGWPYGRQTPLAEIERLPPGTKLQIDTETVGSNERRWYDPAQAVDPGRAQELAAMPRRRLADLLEEALRDSVRRRLMADVPVGTMCSGGLDSSLLTALARDEHPQVVAFNCSLVDEPEADEGQQGERFAAALGIELETVRITAQGWCGALVEAVGFHEYPLNGPSSVPISLIADLARRRGVKALLTGEAADELFGGYGNHDGFHDFLPRYVRLYRRASAFIRRDRQAIAAMRYRRRGGAARRPAPPLEPAEEPLHVRRAISERAARAYSHHSGARAELEAGLLGDLSLHSFPFLLNRMDKDAMARSVETRLPFLDPEVVTLALNLPLEARLQPRLKGILRDVGRRNLPGSTARRVKYPGMGFNAGRRIEQRAQPEFLRDGALRELLPVSDDVWRQLISPPNSRAAVRLWSGEIWARLFVAGESPARVEEELWGPAGP